MNTAIASTFCESAVRPDGSGASRIEPPTMAEIIKPSNLDFFMKLPLRLQLFFKHARYRVLARIVHRGSSRGGVGGRGLEGARRDDNEGLLYNTKVPISVPKI